VFELRILKDDPEIKFDKQLPMFNWPYPFDTGQEFPASNTDVYEGDQRQVSRTAAYFHIPFCETICNFCPFSRERLASDSDLDEYVEAITREIVLKRQYLGRYTVDAIAVGGGTPSLLTPKQIESFGVALWHHLDLSQLREFTFEVEVKSVSRERLCAMRDIGVNRISFGAQTVSERFRHLFNLDATWKQVASSAALINETFPYTNADVLYGMAGETIEEFENDLLAVSGLNTTTVDVYPLNNLTAPIRMHRSLESAGLELLSGGIRHRFRRHASTVLGDLGYSPISGYAYARSGKREERWAGPVQQWPKFLYHDLYYGHDDDRIVGYGSSALSRLPGYNLYNVSNRRAYVRQLLSNDVLPYTYSGGIRSAERGIVTFPYRGELDKRKVLWNQVPEESLLALQRATDADLVVDEGSRYVLTKQGWLFYANLMYYLMPSAAKATLSAKIDERLQHGAVHEQTELKARVKTTIG